MRPLYYRAEQFAFFRSGVLSSDPDVILYTDGACSGNPGPGGWAVILKKSVTGERETLTGGEVKTTNNRMELTAAIQGLKAVKPGARWRVRLVSDSEYVIKGLSEWIENWIAKGWRRGKQPVLNVDLWKQLYELSQRFEMSYEHVRGHSGHPENEECDRLAVAAIEAVRRGAPPNA